MVNLILDYLTVTKKNSKNNLSNFISNNVEIDVSSWSYLQIISNLTELENNFPDILQSPPSSLLQKIYITPLISELK
ncbi:hypothetical protein HIC20_00275 [Buchnera aphidicola (Hormaphis cornu)]|nr:hypothetical protein HIC20_00275 [Buchnera aphidicola (Hormaphis cornu)]